MKGKAIYYAIIVLGIGAISYMYYMTDTANRDTLADDIDASIKEQNLKINI